MSDTITVRSMEDVAYLLNILFYNMNNLSKTYYDMFINPEPMDIELSRYDENGTLVKVVVPNRAKDTISAYVGNGNPNGSQSAKVGALYVDTLTSDLYYKGSGIDAYGWILIWNATNLSYLSPTGDGSQLKDLNMNSVSLGTLAVNHGGTGVTSITGVLKGNGTDAISSAVDGSDFLGPNSSTGLICFYPVSNIPAGWLLCDGSAYSRTTYSRLFAKIGITYGSGDDSTTFNVPDLRGYFIRCWDSTRTLNVVQEGAVGSHTHNYSGVTGSGSAHNHTRGTMDIVGQLGSNTSLGGIMQAQEAQNSPEASGAFSVTEIAADGNAHSGSGSSPSYNITFRASDNWTGSTSTESLHTHDYSGISEANAVGQENIVINKALYPIIKY